jgi:hypothetical protein
VHSSCPFLQSLRRNPSLSPLRAAASVSDISRSSSNGLLVQGDVNQEQYTGDLPALFSRSRAAAVGQAGDVSPIPIGWLLSLVAIANNSAGRQPACITHQ